MKELVGFVSGATSAVNLVIEAPLSVCFGRNGNPKGRSMEKQGSEHRYWFNGLACGVLVASIYLLRDLHAHEPSVPVRLFEGFVSFKDPGVPSNHHGDVCRLRDVVKDCRLHASHIFSQERFRREPTDRLESVLELAGLPRGFPPVIKP